jgi:hypothetical protein
LFEELIVERASPNADIAARHTTAPAIAAVTVRLMQMTFQRFGSTITRAQYALQQPPEKDLFFYHALTEESSRFVCFPHLIPT